MVEHTKEPWCVPTALEQIVSCDFACEAGPLEKNIAWGWLKHCLMTGPKYLMGQTVWYELKAEVAGQVLTQWTGFTIVGCKMSSDTERVTWVYDLSRDPPGPYHYGKVQFQNVAEAKLFFSNPCPLTAARAAKGEAE